MDISNPRPLRTAADRSLSVGREPKKVITGYVTLLAVISLLTVILDYIISTQLDNAVGLSNLGLNSLLSTFQLVLPLVQALAILCLNLGHEAALLRISRGQYADHTDLKAGLDRFWPLLRMTLLQTALFLALSFVLIYPCAILFMMTPFSAGFMELYSSLTVLDESSILQLYSTLEPMMILFAIVYFIVCIPIYFHLRLANFVLLDHPRAGAMFAMSESFRMMRKNCVNLFKVDLRLWWYYALTAVLLVVSYGNLLLPLLGVALPWSAEMSLYIFYVLYLAGTLAVEYLLRNRVQMTYIQVYEALRPKEAPQQGVILGNIFQM